MRMVSISVLLAFAALVQEPQRADACGGRSALPREWAPRIFAVTTQGETHAITLPLSIRRLKAVTLVGPSGNRVVWNRPSSRDKMSFVDMTDRTRLEIAGSKRDRFVIAIEGNLPEATWRAVEPDGGTLGSVSVRGGRTFVVSKLGDIVIVRAQPALPTTTNA